jgi:ParB family transcriptional regulator, chromosome partitioning protein
MNPGSGKQEGRKALGRGLQALIESRTPKLVPPVSGGAPGETAAPPSEGGVRQIPVELIQPNPYQPRRAFHADRLDELAASIRASGVVQPILVRPAGERFEIVAGERRWRASRAAGLATIPAIVQEIGNDRLLEVALIENIQREDLNAIETALAFEQLSHDFGLTHEQIAQRTGKDRATITNFLRLLKLASEVQVMVGEGALTMGHAKVLVGLEADVQRKIAHRIVEQGLTVRAVEKLVSPKPEAPAKPAKAVDPNMRAAIQEMERTLGTRVKIVEGQHGAGRIEIEYYNAGDLHRLYKRLAGEEE